MKTAAYRTHRPLPIPFPNAMTRRQMLNKLLDGLIVAASGMGLAASLMFLLALS